MMWSSVRLKTDHHYIVALRDLVNMSGQLIEPSPAFLSLRYVYIHVVDDKFYAAYYMYVYMYLYAQYQEPGSICYWQHIYRMLYNCINLTGMLDSMTQNFFSLFSILPVWLFYNYVGTIYWNRINHFITCSWTIPVYVRPILLPVGMQRNIHTP